jgi:sugar phosphate isomerase/epimerase
MPRFSPDQIAYAEALHGPLDRARSLEFLKVLDIHHSVGHWSAGDFCDRFAPPGYHSNDTTFSNTFEGQCRRTKAAGIDAIEIHQSVFEKTLNGDLDWPAVERAKSGFLAELGMTVPACNINTWTNPVFRLGGPCNPNPALRRAALDEILKAVELSKALKIPVIRRM